MDQRIASAIRLFEGSLAEELRIEDIAASTGLSLHHFHRLFVAETGETPGRFWRRIRMDAAALRLRWSDEPAVATAMALGYRDRTSFVRAFHQQFGVPPGAYRRAYREQVAVDQFTVAGRNIMLREVAGTRLLTRRYLGYVSSLRIYWDDFCSRLPGNLVMPGKRLFVGMMHDDPRTTATDQVRYECAVTIADDELPADSFLADNGLQLARIKAGRYGSIEHRGPVETIEATYDTLVHKWLIPNGRIPSHEPALEIHTVPRHHQDRGSLAFTVLIHIE